MFESLVNSVRCKTMYCISWAYLLFESLVNSVRCKTDGLSISIVLPFESLVNSVRCKTIDAFEEWVKSLRALLIQ